MGKMRMHYMLWRPRGECWHTRRADIRGRKRTLELLSSGYRRWTVSSYRPHYISGDTWRVLEKPLMVVFYMRLLSMNWRTSMLNRQIISGSSKPRDLRRYLKFWSQRIRNYWPHQWGMVAEHHHTMLHKPHLVLIRRTYKITTLWAEHARLVPGRCIQSDWGPFKSRSW